MNLLNVIRFSTFVVMMSLVIGCGQQQPQMPPAAYQPTGTVPQQQYANPYGANPYAGAPAAGYNQGYAGGYNQGYGYQGGYQGGGQVQWNSPYRSGNVQWGYNGNRYY